MALPNVSITHVNGVLGQVADLPDGVFGFIAIGATEVATDAMFKLGKSYCGKKLTDFEALGITAENNPLLFKNLKEFYAEAGDGRELWLMGFPATDTFATVLDKDNEAGARLLLQSTVGKLRGLFAFKAPGSGYTPTITGGLDADVTAAMTKAQDLGDWAASTLYAPIFTLIEGYGFEGAPAALTSLTTMTFNRVGIVIGDTVAGSPNACMSVVAGRAAIAPVQRKISRVRDGALRPQAIYIGDQLVDVADVETINEKGYITFRTFTGKSGYFVAEDNLATAVVDDYRSLTNRRVIDKAYRIAYDTLLSSVNDEVPIASDGNLSPSWCAALEGDVEQAVVAQMTANGNLGNDPGDPADTGVACSIPYAQKILTNSKWKAGLRVKPNGYGKYIEVELGFKTA